MVGSDADAVARARAGDDDAFRVLVERYSRRIFGLAFRMTGNEHDAEDVVQETFLRAFRRLKQFESRANFGSWLYRIAVNCSFDFMRTRQRREERHNSIRAADPTNPDPSQESVQLVADDPTPDRLTFSAEVQREVHSALERLSPKEKAAFVMRHFEGMSMKEIAGVLGIRTNATKNTIFRAVKKLRERLEPLMSPTK